MNCTLPRIIIFVASTEKLNSIPLNPVKPQAADEDGTDGMMADRETYKQFVMENIEYAYLIQNMSLDREHIDELAELIVDTVCSSRRMIRIAGDDYPAQVVKSRFLKLDSSHIRYVLSSMSDNHIHPQHQEISSCRPI